MAAVSALGDVAAAAGYRRQPLVPLSDAQVQRFVRDGMLEVQPATLPREFHAAVVAETRALDAAGDVCWQGNGCFPTNPKLGVLLREPHVHGALTGLMGARYAIHPHRHCHASRPGTGEQALHQDCQDDCYVRRCRPRWCMALYYPQRVDANFGPTAICKGSHFFVRDRPDDGSEQCGNWRPQPEEHRCTIDEAGTVVIIAFELWHRATKNFASRDTRYMFKFPVVRVEEPTTPRWSHSPRWVHDNMGLLMVDEKARSVFQWMCGSAGMARQPVAAEPAEIPSLIATMRTEQEPARTDAAFRLGALGTAAVVPLVDALRTEAEEKLDVWNSDDPDHQNPSQLMARTALVEAGVVAVPALVAVLRDTEERGCWASRAAAADAIGDIGPAAAVHAAEAVEALCERLDDSAENEWVVRNAAEV
eukprot:SAG31_NODE_6944_length_1841_cov_1.619977_2_plen_420_part_00